MSALPWNICIGERAPFFGTLSPVVRPPKVDNVVSRHRNTLDGINTGDRAQKTRPFPDGNMPEQGNT